MKRCPTCNRVETDEALVFCRADGTRLVTGSLASDSLTMVLPTSSRGMELPTQQLQNLPSIAVLPFVNMSADAENEYFCDGLAEELLNALAKIENLKVAARTSSFSFKGKNVNVDEIGRALHVNSVLEGSVRKSGNRLRITVQLINASDGYHLWSERYDREMQDIFEVQDEITLAVVAARRLTASSLRLRLFVPRSS
jgi:adenylate cyclase